MSDFTAGTADASLSDDLSIHDSIDHEVEYVRIGELAKEYDITLRTLRFYEDKGMLQPKRDGATRLYSRRDISRLKLILLGRKVGFPLRDVKHMLDLYDPNGSNIRQIKITLDKSTKQLVRLEKQRAELAEATQDLQDLIETLKTSLAQITNKS